MRLKIKRAYDPAEKSDGLRVLVDRLWPRGVSKADAHIDLWPKEIAPSNKLRTWFHADPEKRFGEFERKYKAELKNNSEAVQEAVAHLKGIVTLVSAVKDLERSHVPVLKAFIEHL